MLRGRVGNRFVVVASCFCVDKVLLLGRVSR